VIESDWPGTLSRAQIGLFPAYVPARRGAICAVEFRRGGSLMIAAIHALIQAVRGPDPRRGGFTTAWVLIFSMAACPRFAGAQVAGQPGEIYQFGAGARALAMGSAQTAVVQDVNAVYYNPAGLGLLPGRELQFMRASLFEGASYDYIAYAQNKKKRAGGWGFELIRLGVSGAEGRDEFNNEAGGFAYSETSLGLAHGWRGVFHPKMSIGIKGKMLNRTLASSSDRIISVDFGLQSGPWMDEKLMIGAVVQNGLGLAQGDTDDRLKPLIRAGVSYKVVGPLSLAADVSQSGEFRIGTEYAFGMTALRVGMTDRSLSFGGGLQLREKYLLDVALQNHAVLGMSQRISVGYRFGERKGLSGGKPPKMQFYASEYLNNALAELKKRNYLKASSDLDTAHGIDPKVFGAEWKPKGERLRTLVKALELEAHPEDQKVFQENTPAAFIAYQAVQAYIGNEEDRASLLAHAALGSDPRNPGYRRLLDAIGKLTGREKKRDEILPPARLLGLKMKFAVDEVYRRRFPSAVETLREALWLDPNNTMAWTRLGSCYYAMGDRERAAAAYGKALELDPADQKLRAFMEKQGLAGK